MCISCSSLISGAAGNEGKGATSEERAERDLLPTNIAPDAQMYFVGVCPCCNDVYLSNQFAKQCGKRAFHEEEGYGKKLLTLDKQQLSAEGECAGDKKKIV